jgi:polyhydroxyalkanoate synthesis repressor PhaR
MAYVIKRYSNRKLYDTQASRYVTLEELEELIRAGKEIAVVDVTTGEDLTSVTLAQIILENERSHRAALPSAFLHQLVKYGEAWQDFFQKSLRASLENIMNNQREADRVFREWASRAGWLPPPAPPTPPAAAPAAPAEAMVTAGSRKTETADDPESLREEVAALREQLRALEQRLERKREH